LYREYKSDPKRAIAYFHALFCYTAATPSHASTASDDAHIRNKPAAASDKLASTEDVEMQSLLSSSD
jgi:hypothetical protein